MIIFQSFSQFVASSVDDGNFDESSCEQSTLLAQIVQRSCADGHRSYFRCKEFRRGRACSDTAAYSQVDGGAQEVSEWAGGFRLVVQQYPV